MHIHKVWSLVRAGKGAGVSLTWPCPHSKAMCMSNLQGDGDFPFSLTAGLQREGPYIEHLSIATTVERSGTQAKSNSLGCALAILSKALQ